MKNNKRFWDKFFLVFFILMGCATQTFCILLIDHTFLQFITTIGVFFIPFCSSLTCIIGLIWFFVFRFPELKDTKAHLSHVYKKGNVDTQDFNKIGIEIDNGIKNQREIEYQEQVQKIDQKQKLFFQKRKKNKWKNREILEIYETIEKDNDIGK